MTEKADYVGFNMACFFANVLEQGDLEATREYFNKCATGVYRRTSVNNENRVFIDFMDQSFITMDGEKYVWLRGW